MVEFAPLGAAVVVRALAPTVAFVEHLPLGAFDGVAFLAAAALVVEDVAWVAVLVDTVSAFSLLEVRM